ncbi:MAG: FliG C-terminal domain-containing protein [Elusimicrobiota bacterium]
MKLALVALLLACVPCRASVTAEEAAVAERLSAQANEFLASLLGPGRAKAVVTVQGEQTHSTSQAESIIPTPLDASALQKASRTPLALPGYVKDKQALKELTEPDPTDITGTMLVRKSQQSSSWESGLQVKLIRVSVILDTRVTQAQAASVAEILPKLLHLDKDRGDELTILRADMRLNSWQTAAKDYFLSKDGMGTLANMGGVLVLVVLSVILLHFLANSAIKTFMWELSSHRTPPTADPQPAPALPASSASPELLTGGMPSLSLETDEPAPSSAPLPLLGQRFDFLTSINPGDLARLVGGEPPEDLALIFATLAASHPDLSASVFASLDANIRADVSRTLANMTATDPQRLESLESRLKNLVDFGVRGPERLGKILSRLPPVDREALFNEVVASNPNVAQELERSLFSFEDITQLRETDFRRLIVAVPYAHWGLALRGAQDEIVNRVLSELDPGIQKILREAMSTPQPRVKILEARSKIISQTLLMASRGDIVLRNSESSEMI